MSIFTNGSLLLAVTATACVANPVPTSVPVASSASVRAPEAPRAAVAVAFAEEPPLPGEELAGWRGLAGPVDAVDHHAHLHGAAPSTGSHDHAHHGAAPSTGSHDHAHHGAAPNVASSRPDAEPAIYVCPMHPEVTSKEPGRCGLCGMNLELRR